MGFTFSLGADSARKHIIDANGTHNFEINHDWHLLRASIELMVIGYGYSSCLYAVESNPEKDVYLGTTHGHSNWSIDAFGLGNQKAGSEDGYRFARGEAVSHMGGEKVQRSSLTFQFSPHLKAKINECLNPIP